MIRPRFFDSKCLAKGKTASENDKQYMNLIHNFSQTKHVLCQSFPKALSLGSAASKAAPQRLQYSGVSTARTGGGGGFECGEVMVLDGI